MVWNKNVGAATTFRVIYIDRIPDAETFEPTNWSSAYDPDTDTFKFALDTIPERISWRMPLPSTCFVLAAHEATHKVQFYRGDEPKPSPKSITSDSHDYLEDEHEAEAWTER